MLPEMAKFGGIVYQTSLSNEDEETLKKVVRHYPLRRVGVPSDVVPIVLLLASDQTSYVTGQTISVSGGYAM